MYAVERLGSYITKGVYTVSGPFHPFGGAVDIIVVEQPDGSFKSSPWYVRFGKFQGVLKAREKVVVINVNGSEAKFNMFLNQRGEAYFLRERKEGDGESEDSYSSDEMDDRSPQDGRMITKSCSYNGRNSSPVAEFDGSNGKIVAVTNPQQSRISRFVFGRRSMEEDLYRMVNDNIGVVRMSTLETADIAADLVETFMLDEGDLGEKLAQMSETSGDFDESHLKNVDEDENSAGDCLNSQISDNVEACPEKKVDSDQDSNERDAVLSGNGVPEKDNDLSRVQPSNYCETSQSLTKESNGLHNQSEEMLANGNCGGNHICAETMHTTAELQTEDAGHCQAEDLELEEKLSAMSPEQPNPSSPSLHGHDRAAIGSNEVKSEGASLVSGFRNPVDQVHDENGDKITRKIRCLRLGSADDSAQPVEDCGPTKSARVPVSESSEEDQFIFSDIDDCEPGENQASTFPDSVDKERFVQMNGTHKFVSLKENSKEISSPISVPRRHTEEGARLAESLPNLWSDKDDLGTENLCHPLSHSLELNTMQLNCTNSDDVNQSSHGNLIEKDAQALECSKDGVDNSAVGDQAKAIDSSRGSWSLWPFPFRRQRSKKTMQPTLTDTRSSDAGNVSANNNDSENEKKHVKDTKKMLKATSPTSDELASLNLKEGSNAVTFTFSTAMLGRQKVDARIYLWKWNTRIVISDVDGTITKSDVLGQFMPLVGIDWSQTGVVHLFSAIKDNGYQFLYLSARSISQAYITRQFLVNLKQDGKSLPDGPVVISPDGLFPSLFREVIRRAPHEFKIACLEDIKALFPPDCSPFYAGFGNRDTDEISYLKVGIPKGKIFIINPKGEVAVNRLVDAKSYTSLHALVNGMFPVMTSPSQVQEDYNSWNFWKLPPPHFDDI